MKSLRKAISVLFYGLVYQEYTYREYWMLDVVMVDNKSKTRRTETTEIDRLQNETPFLHV